MNRIVSAKGEDWGIFAQDTEVTWEITAVITKNKKNKDDRNDDSGLHAG
jgi:hypothetical protein